MYWLGPPSPGWATPNAGSTSMRLTLWRFGPLVGVIIVYAIAIVLMAWTIRPPSAERLLLHAARTLPKNTLLRDEHLKPRKKDLPYGYFHELPDWQGEMKGRYLVEEVPNGKPIKIGNVAAAPDLSPTGTPLFVVSLKDRPELARALNAGAAVALIGEKVIAPNATVGAILCDKPDAKGTASCDAVVAVSSDELTALQTAPKITVVLRKLP